VSERGKEGYGPMPFGDEALQVSQSYAIMNRIRNEFPNVARLLDWDRETVLGYLKDRAALSGYKINHSFYVYHRGYNDGVKVWREYKDEIERYAGEICQKLGSQFYEELRPARQVLAEHIHQKYYDKFPY